MHFTITPEELKKLPDVKIIEHCPKCGKFHMVEYTKDVDDNDVGFVACSNGYCYLVAVRGKRVHINTTK